MNRPTHPTPRSLRIAFAACALAANVIIGLCIDALATPEALPTVALSSTATAAPVTTPWPRAL